MISEFLILTGFVLTGYFIGLEFNLAFIGVLVGLFLFSVLQVLQLYRLSVYLSGQMTGDMLIPSSLWKNIYAQIQGLKQKDHPDSHEFQTLLRFQKGVSVLSMGVVFLNERNQIEWLNQSACRLLNLRDPEDVGRNVTYFLRQPELVAGLNQKDAPVHLELDIEEYNLDVLITSFEERHFIIVQDITHLRRLQKFRQELLSDVSHELRSPLTVVQAYAEILSNADANEGKSIMDVKEMSQDILRYTKDMNTIIDNLLSSELLDDRALTEDQCEEINMSAVAEELMLEAQKFFPEKACQLNVQIESAKKIYGNRYEIKSALSNLLHNALRYSFAGGTVNLCWQVDEFGGHFSVIDYGKGIPAEHIPRLTERFYRVDKDRARDSGGIGLGLAIVKRLLQRHKASLHIESEVGKGSTFRCDFPLDSLRD